MLWSSNTELIIWQKMNWLSIFVRLSHPVIHILQFFRNKNWLPVKTIISCWPDDPDICYFYVHTLQKKKKKKIWRVRVNFIEDLLMGHLLFVEWHYKLHKQQTWCFTTITDSTCLPPSTTYLWCVSCVCYKNSSKNVGE